MLGLRTYDGVDLGRFEALYGVDLCRRNRERIDGYVGDALLELGKGSIRPTRRGLAVADRLAVSFEV